MVTPSFPPLINGVSLYVYHLVRGLVDHKIHIRVHTIERSLPQKVPSLDLKLDDLDVKSFKNLFYLGGPSEDHPVSLSYVMSTIKASNSFDVIHIHDSPRVCNDLLILTLKKLRPNKPVVFTPHGGFAHLPVYKRVGVFSSTYKFFSKTYWSLGILQRTLQVADHILAVSPLQAKLFGEVCTSQKVSMIPEAVPSYCFVDKPTFTDDQRLKILFIGRIMKEKGIENLLYAIHDIANMTNDRNNVELVCIGPDWGYLQETLKIIAELKLDRLVKILGPLSENEKIKYLSWCDVLVLPSYFEAFGLPLIEAMARGKPVIATETIGGSSLVRNSETGFLVKIGEPQSIAYALTKFLDNPRLKYEMGQKALKYASKFQMESMIENHIRVYKKILDDC